MNKSVFPLQIEMLPDYALNIRSRMIGQVELPEDLIRDLTVLETIPCNPDYSEFAVGHWASLALFNRDGDAESSASHEYAGAGQWTTHGHKLPVINRLAESVFAMEALKSLRIFVAQNGMIRTHRDYTEFSRGFTRIHLVLQTNEKAMNGEGSIAYRMNEGSVWFLDGREPHWAVNLANTPRWHLVGDFDPGLTAEECLNKSHRQQLTSQSLVQRELIPKEVAALIAVASRTASPDSLAKICEATDAIFIRFDCSEIAGTPYDLMLPHLGEQEACVKHLIERRRYFLGF